MGDKEIKSSIELAMEKLAQMPRATPEEMDEQRRKELLPQARALGAKLRDGRIRTDEIEAELDRHGEEAAPILREALLSELKGSLDADEPEQNERVIEALQAVRPELDATELRARAGAVVEAYLAKRLELEQQFDREYRTGLQKRGISGSALRPNLRDSRVLRDRLQEPRRIADEQLASLLCGFLGR